MVSVALCLLLAPPGPGFRQVWAEEFSGTGLDPTRWEAPAQERQGNQSVWDPALVEVRDGFLRLRVEPIANPREGGPRYRCGAVRTRRGYVDPPLFQSRFGYYEVRCSLPTNFATDMWFAFWIMAGDIRDGQTDSRQGTEIDIMETFGLWEGKVSHALHWGGYAETLNSAGLPGRVPGPLVPGSFHRFGLYWDAERYVFFIDGEVVAETDAVGLGSREGRVKSQGTCLQPGYLKLTAEAAAWAGPSPNWEPEPPSDVILIDSVRVWEGTW